MNVIPKVSRLSSRVLRVLGCNPGPMTLQGTNVYMVGTGSKRILIDAGQDGFPEYIGNIGKLLQEENVKIEHLVLTHWHQDHVGALDDLVPVLKDHNTTVHKYQTAEPQEVSIPKVFQSKILQDNHVFQTEGATLRIIHTPGHTTDHVILYLEEEKAVFSGDCILGEGTAVFEDLYDYMKSLDKILNLNPALIYPSHGPVIEEPIDKIKYYIHHRLEREKQIFAFIKGSNSPVTSMDIVKGVYKDTSEHLHPAAEYNVSHHLAKLLKEHRVQENDGKYIVPQDGKL